MSFYQLMFLEVRSSLVFSGFGLKPPASGFQSYSYSNLMQRVDSLKKTLMVEGIEAGREGYNRG